MPSLSFCALHLCKTVSQLFWVLDEDDGCDKSDLLATSMDYETISDDGDIGVEEEPEVYKGESFRSA